MNVLSMLLGVSNLQWGTSSDLSHHPINDTLFHTIRMDDNKLRYAMRLSGLNALSMKGTCKYHDLRLGILT
jgi:hypothetical protein